jgi:hypothetical protein
MKGLVGSNPPQQPVCRLRVSLQVCPKSSHSCSLFDGVRDPEMRPISMRWKISRAFSSLSSEPDPLRVKAFQVGPPTLARGFLPFPHRLPERRSDLADVNRIRQEFRTAHRVKNSCRLTYFLSATVGLWTPLVQ